MRNISRIRANINEQTAATLVSSKLDNMNSLLVGVPDVVLNKLQLLQNNAARLVLRKRKRDHVTPMLRLLHWLPVRSRIKFKICLLAFKAIHGLAPRYISQMIAGIFLLVTSGQVIVVC